MDYLLGALLRGPGREAHLLGHALGVLRPELGAEPVLGIRQTGVAAGGRIAAGDSGPTG